MPVSQGSGGYMPGMTLRAWAVVTAAGALVKGYGVSAVAKGPAGEYTLTLSGAAISANAIIKADARFSYGAFLTAIAPVGNNFTYTMRQIDGASLGVDALNRVEVYE